VAAAAVVGFLGNEEVAWFQIRTGHRSGSTALVADGLHARIDGLTALAVLVAVAGSALGFPLVDPLIGLALGLIQQPAGVQDHRLQQPAQFPRQHAQPGRRAVGRGHRTGMGGDIALRVPPPRRLARRHARRLPGHGRRLGVQRRRVAVQAP